MLTPEATGNLGGERRAMARYRTTIESFWSPERAFDYMANFANAAEWDPGVVSGAQSTEGPVRLGARFDLEAAFGKSTIPLDYVIAAYEPHSRVVLVAETDKIKSTDEITIVANGTGCLVTYDAELETRGPFRWLSPVVSLMFRRIGDRARDSLRRELNK